MRKKNILFVIDSLGIGGAEKVILTLSEEFISKSYRVDIISCEDKIEFEIPMGISTHTIGFKKSFLMYTKYRKKLYTKILELEEKNSQKFELILVNLQKSTKLMQNYQHKNIYHIIHNTLSQSAFKKRTRLQIFFKRKKLQKIYKDLNIITVSLGVKDDLMHEIRVKPKSIKTIYNPIDKEKISQLAIEANPIIDKKYIIHVGRFHSQKRHDILLKAYKESNIDAKLVLVGEGSEKDEIVKLINQLDIEKKVILTGFIQNPYSIIKNASFLVLSSDYEGFGNVLVEALMLNTPVISTDCKSGPNEILIDELKDYLVPKNDIDTLALKIKTLYNSNSKIAIDNKYTDKFDTTNIIKEYEDLILRENNE